MPMRMMLSRAAKRTSSVKTMMATRPMPRAGQKDLRISPAAKAIGFGNRAAPITAAMSQRKMMTSLMTTMMGMSESEKTPWKRPSLKSLSPSSRGLEVDGVAADRAAGLLLQRPAQGGQVLADHRPWT